MPCSLCGDICRCRSEEDSSASTRWVTDDDPLFAAVVSEPLPASAVEEGPPPAASPDNPADSSAEDAPAWRQELAARLNRYHAKHKPRPPRYPSLRLRFEEPDASRAASATSDQPPPFSQSASSRHALALDNFAENAASLVESEIPGRLPLVNTQDPRATFSRADDFSQQHTALSPATAKIIEFPRFWTPPPEALGALAEPVIDRPRILEAPEVVPPPPSLGGITIEPILQPELEKRPGIDIPLQSAPLARRIFSAAIDSAIIASACAIFGFIFWKMTAIEPPLFQTIGLCAALLVLFWFAYQYLLLVYSGSTPGLRLVKLRLARFDGTPAPRRLRRWRVLASFLSAVSLGMGYAWVFLDEDSLCWHDRITRTYLAPADRG
jgi:uncharacterized RDD family membrane protein YckC